MSETRLLTDSIKSGLLEQLCNLIDEKFVPDITPPDAILPFLGQTGKVSCEIRAMIDQWIVRVARALNCGTVTWEDFLNMLPPDFAQDLNAAVIRNLSQRKE